MRRKAERGFTLMELMVVIVIVAILAAVAVPLYINYVKDATRTEAKGAIGAIITAEQTHFQQHDTYIDATNEDFQNKAVLNCDLTESLHNWTFDVDGDANGFIVEAVGRTEEGKPAKGLGVRYRYTRLGGGSWEDFTPTP